VRILDFFRCDRRSASCTDTVFFIAEDKDNKLMSSEGLEATEAEMDEVLQEMAEETALQQEALGA
jgi:hypothetical protein